MKKIIFVILALTVLLTLPACNTQSIEGTWYSVEDGTMFNFQDGYITVSGETVGQYEESGNYVVISLEKNSNNQIMYVTTAHETEVLSDTINGEGHIFFCRGLVNAERIIQEREEELKAFSDYLFTHEWPNTHNINGTWETANPSAQYKCIDIFLSTVVDHVYLYHSDSSPKAGTYIPTCFEEKEDGTFNTRVEMKDRGYNSPTVYFYINEPFHYVAEVWMDKSGKEEELIMDFHSVTDTIRYKKRLDE